MPSGEGGHGPLDSSEVKARLVLAIEGGHVRFGSHALAEMKADKIGEEEVLQVLRAGVVEPGELEKGSWRYRVSVTKVHGRALVSTYAVVAFRVDLTIVVTAWRKRR